MDAGMYREHIIIEKATGEERDKAGNVVVNWDVYFKSYAYVNNLNGKEYWAASQVQAEDTVQFIFRYHEKFRSMDTKHYRINWKGKLYNIIFIDNVKYRNETVKIKAKVLK